MPLLLARWLLDAWDLGIHDSWLGLYSCSVGNTALARVRARAVGTAEEVGGGAKLAGNDTGALKMKKNETKTLENDDLAATQMTQQQQRIHARNQVL